MLTADKNVSGGDDGDSGPHGKSYELTYMFNGLGEDISEQLPGSITEQLQLCSIRVLPGQVAKPLAYRASILMPPKSGKGRKEHIHPDLDGIVFNWFKETEWRHILKLDEAEFCVNQVLKYPAKDGPEPYYRLLLNTRWCPAKKDYHNSSGLNLNIRFDSEYSHWVACLGCQSHKRAECKSLHRKYKAVPCGKIHKCIKASHLIERPTTKCPCCGVEVQYSQESGQDRAIIEHMELSGCSEIGVLWAQCPICNIKLQCRALPGEAEAAAKNRAVNLHLDTKGECVPNSPHIDSSRQELGTAAMEPSGSEPCLRAASPPKHLAPPSALATFDWHHDKIEQLQCKLNAEIEAENYRECAKLRDEIRSLKGKGPKGDLNCAKQAEIRTPPVTKPIDAITVQLYRLEVSLENQDFMCTWLVGAPPSVAIAGAPETKMRTKHGETFKARLVLCGDEDGVELAAEQSMKALQFTQRIFGLAFSGEKAYRKKENEPKWDHKSMLCFPTLNSGGTDSIDWGAIDSLLSGEESWNRATACTCEVSQTVLYRRHMTGEALFHVIDKDGSNMESIFDDPVKGTFLDYFSKRAMEGKCMPIIDPHEDLVTLRENPSKIHNCMDVVHEKTVTSRIKLPPQICYTFPLHSVQLQHFMLVPSVLAGVERYLARSELIQRIDAPLSSEAAKSLLDRVSEAMTHPELTVNTGEANYERLEHLGDRVLKFICANQVFVNHPGAKNASTREGELTKLKVELERNDVLSVLAKEANLLDSLVTKDWLAHSSWGRSIRKPNSNPDPNSKLTLTLTLTLTLSLIGAPWGIQRKYQKSPCPNQKKLLGDLVEAMVGAYFCAAHDSVECNKFISGIAAASHFLRWIFSFIPCDNKNIARSHRNCGCLKFNNVHKLLTFHHNTTAARSTEKAKELCFRLGRDPTDRLVTLVHEALTPRGKSANDLERFFPLTLTRILGCYLMPTNCRLEFLGDAVLDMVIVLYLFHTHLHATPSQLHDLRENHVRDSMYALNAIASPFELHHYIEYPDVTGRKDMSLAVEDLQALRADRTEGAQPDLQAFQSTDEPGAKVAKQNLADSFEAIAAALFADAGFDVVASLFRPAMLWRQGGVPSPPLPLQGCKGRS